MDYRNKIQLLEEKVRELENERKLSEIASDENREAMKLVVNGVQDYMNQSNEKMSGMKELRDRIEKSKTNKELDELRKQLDLHSVVLDTAKEKLKPTLTLLKKSNASYLEMLRTQSRIIRTVSVTASNDLDSRILEFEELLLKFHEWIESVDKLSTTISRNELSEMLQNAYTLEVMINYSIKITRESVKGTIEFFKK